MFRGGEPGDPMPWGAAVGLALLLAAGGIVLVVVGRRASAGRLKKNPLVEVSVQAVLPNAPPLRTWNVYVPDTGT